MKNSTCPWGKGKHTSTATTPAGPEEEMAAPEAMARVIKPRKCHPLKSPNTVPEHRAPVNGVQYDPKVLQLIIRRNVCPTGTAMEWKASDGANKPLKAAIIYWLERGWVGSKGPVRMREADAHRRLQGRVQGRPPENPARLRVYREEGVVSGTTLVGTDWPHRSAVRCGTVANE
jgi:hypothetical protein